MPETTFTGPDLTTFLGLDALGLTAAGQRLTPRKAVVECRMQIGFEDLLWLVGRRSDAWPMCRGGGGDPRNWWCACGASPAPAAAECGGRTQLGWPSRGHG